MSKIFFIADPHFGDESILKIENRPFKDVNYMDEDIIGYWNSEVEEDDIVYVLGDFGNKDVVNYLNGTKYLIKGNHDVLSNQEYRDAGFAEVYDHPIVIDGFWILSHEPIYINKNMPYVNIFGHVHSNPIFSDYSSNHYCVCVERTDYYPISFGYIKNKIKECA